MSISNSYQSILDQFQNDETKGIRLEVPGQLMERVERFQKAYRLKFERVISRADVLLLMASYGSERTEIEIDSIIKSLV